MRPKLLEIEGLQSFQEKQTIDFETLGETGLFGIFGPTGSGKSSVLDAITLALYGKVKRAERDTQGIINMKREILRVAFTFEILKEGVRRTFRVERQYNRKKGSGNLSEAKVARILDITDGERPLCDKPQEVSRFVQGLLGLTQEDFTRAVVLPQNSFQEFLSLTHGERRKMLERIFYLEEYGRELSDKLGRRFNEARSRWEHLSGEMKAYEDAGPEALGIGEQALTESEVAMQAAETAFRDSRKVLEDARILWERLEALEGVRVQWTEHQRHAVLFAEKERTLQLAGQARTVLPLILRAEQLHAEWDAARTHLDSLSQAVRDAEHALAEVTTEKQMLARRIAEVQPQLVSRKARLEDARVLEAEVKALEKKIRTEQQLLEPLMMQQTLLLNRARGTEEKLESCGQDQQRIKDTLRQLRTDPVERQQVQAGAALESETAQAEESLALLRTRLADILVKSTAAEESLRQCQVTLEEKKGMLTARKEELKTLLAECPATQNEILAGYEALSQWRILVDKVVRAEEGSRSKQMQANEMRVRLEEAGKKYQDEVRAKKQAEEALTLCQAHFQRLIREQQRSAAWQLAQGLDEGSPCPVCGALEHPAPAQGEAVPDEAAAEESAQLALRMEALEQLLEQNGGVRSQLEARIQVMETQLQQYLLETAATQKEADALRGLLPDMYRKEGVPALHAWLETEQAGADAARQQLADWQNKTGVLEKTVQETQAEVAAAMNAVTALTERYQSLLSRQKEQAEAETLESDRLKDKKSRLKALLPEVLMMTATQRLAEIQARDEQAEGLQKKLTDAERAVMALQDEQKVQQAELATTRNELSRQEEALRQMSGHLDEMTGKLNDIVGPEGFDKAMAEVEQALRFFMDEENRIHARHQKMEYEVAAMREQKTAAGDRCVIFREQSGQAGTELEQALTLHGFAGAAQVREAVLDEAGAEILKKETDAYRQRGNELLRMQLELEAKTQGAALSAEDWHAIKTTAEAAAVRRDEHRAAWEVQKSILESLKVRHTRWAALSGELSELNVKLGHYEQISKLLKANGFIDFIAEERLRYVALKASGLLGVMTRFKYSLEMDTDAGFVIRDNANGGVYRMVSTLSGGETFLTSLALALALSEQVQLKGQSPLEFFFLDEGFGTLDSELLDTVVDALERLSHKERVIGLISHVPELRSRLQRRLVVEPPSQEGHGSRVRTERA